MITNYKQFNEGINQYLKGPTEEEIINGLMDKPDKLLEIGIQKNNFNMVKSAIVNNADLDYRKNTPLVNFGISDNWDRLKLYMDNDIYINSDYKSLLDNYAHINNINILKILIKDCDKEIGTLALQTACFNSSYEAAQLLIDSGVGVNDLNSYYLRHLVLRSDLNDYKMIKLLLDNGANVHVNNDELFKTTDKNKLEILNSYK